MKMRISEIKLGKRFRNDFGDIESLAKSIDQYGLIHPPVVTESKDLVAGERRVLACKHLKWEEIDVRLIEDLSELEKREIELEENIHRKQFTWQEEVKAKEEIHRIKQDQYGPRVKGHDSDGWGIKDTAQALDQSLGTVSQDIRLAEAIEIYPEVAKEKNKGRAWKAFKKMEEKEILEAMAETLNEVESGEMYELINDDCVSWMRSMSDESFNLVIADPPWGIDMDTKSRLSRANNIEYEDGEFVLILIKMAIEECYRILKDGSHMYLFFGIEHYNLIKDLLTETGFEVDLVPVIWNKNHGGSAAKGKTFPKAYETIFHCWKGSRSLNTTHHNVFTFPRPKGSNRIHTAQKSESLIREFVLASSNPGDLILDPFAGSGSTVIASVKEGRFAVGIEKSDSSYANMVDFVSTSLADHKIDDIVDGG